jgi:Fe-S oxidoreductase
VDFPEFIREIRHLLKLQGSKGLQVHGGFFPALMKTMTSTSVKPKHWQWLPKDIETDTQSNILFFGGCAPYFDVFFRTHLGIETKKSLVDSLRLLNFFDIHPALIEDERCCGHDLLWTGDRQNFLKLARLNVEAMHDRGVQEVITSCPECYRALSHDYPEQGVKIHFQVMHIFDFLENEIDKGAVDFKKIHRKVTFQDPCRLSRFDNRPDLPRKLLQRLDTKAFTEMQDRGRGAICCGNSGWTGCDSFSKALQKMRLEQAKATGSDLLITACPKCQIHLRCAMEEPFKGEETKLEMIDLTSVVAETIFWK